MRGVHPQGILYPHLSIPVFGVHVTPDYFFLKLLGMYAHLGSDPKMSPV